MLIKLNTLKQIVLFALIASSITLTGCDKSELEEVQVQDEVNGTPIEGQYIVILKTDASNGSTDVSATNSQQNTSKARNLRNLILSDLKVSQGSIKSTFEGLFNGFTAQLTPEQLEELKKRHDIAFIERDRVIKLANPAKELGDIQQGKITPKPVEPKLPYTSIKPMEGEHLPWNIERVGYGDGTGKTVWIIDSGVDTDHPDLNVDVTKSKSFIYGVTSVEDGYGHGTQVAGIIGAKNNGSGMIGVAANATIVALRVFDNAGLGTTSRVVAAVNFVAANGQPGDVVNISLGGGISSTLDNAVSTAAAKGFIFTIAAGNSGVDCTTISPARVDAPNVYTVSAVDNFNHLWEKSNYGAPVDFAAPGVNITTTKLNGNLSTGSSGTSFAAPHVAGILLLRSDIVASGTVVGDKDTMPESIASSK